MNIWKDTKWRCNPVLYNTKRRTGLRFRFQREVNCNVKRACKDFGNWLRKEYEFPIRVVIYFKSTPYIKAMDGDYVSATFFEPFDKLVKPYIRVATGDYEEMLSEWGEDNALAAILGSVAHELTHYFQWINDSTLMNMGMERQANNYRKKIIKAYAKTREHP
ncbi:hypothetical protein acsn021_11610 [Anaerocolumna cellulosilytica]|uniref:Uncharacterized protein n=1 Tax=Anaerocolumna cellulosilytica TaxID=433286 RepID=A0A6S6R263_9FIRM|nr:hypothetical protein [Anaerocolumna cellulosilytica]MBB5194647.1 hypothetical protein [Anaerocolumna cellulosilytica]BCJ93592.1 hypothetical protein acsn021_11610 [Anaerocolumna cellulosilytica]